MLNLLENNESLDLKYRIQRYQEDNSFYRFTEKGTLCIFGTICRNKPLRSYIEEQSPHDWFQTPLATMMVELLKDLSEIIPNMYIGYTYENRYIMFFKIEEQSNIQRDKLISLVSSRAANFLSTNFYQNPMSITSVFQVPTEEVRNILAFHKMNWVAKRNRILGEHILEIPKDDVSKHHSEVLKECEERGFNLRDLPPFLRTGYAHTLVQ